MSIGRENNIAIKNRICFPLIVPGSVGIKNDKKIDKGFRNILIDHSKHGILIIVLLRLIYYAETKNLVYLNSAKSEKNVFDFTLFGLFF